MGSLDLYVQVNLVFIGISEHGRNFCRVAVWILNSFNWSYNPKIEGLSTPVIYITLLITITLWIYRRIPKDNDLGFLHI